MSQNQHYVPQFYLRNFSEDTKNINIYNLKRQKNIKGNIKNICSKRNFYSENKEIESAFSKLEGKVASIIKKIIDSETLSINSEQEYVELLSFVLWQTGRTKKISDDMLNMVNEIFDYLKPDFAKTDSAKKLGLTLEDFEKVKLTHKNHPLITSLSSLTSVPLIFDLQIALLINKSKKEFITSDSPSILFNSFFNGKTTSLQTGYINRGLQIFFPITPKYMIILFDPNYYSFSMKKDLTIKIYENRDIRRLNGLQVIYCQNNVYYLNYNILDLQEQHKELDNRREQKNIIETVGIKKRENDYSELIRISKNHSRYNLNKLSFIKINSDVNPIPGIRSIEAIEEHERQMKKINSNVL